MTSFMYSANADSWTTVRKTVDESVASSTVLQNDDELFFTTVSGKLYEIDIILIYGSPAGSTTPDIKVALGEDAVIRGGFIAIGDSAADAAQAAAVLANQTGTTSFGTTTVDRPGWLTGVHLGGGGVFRVQWAQSTSGANATIVRAGSLLRYRAM